MNSDILEKTKDFITDLIAPEYRKQMSNNNLDYYKINKKFLNNKKENRKLLRKVNTSFLTKKDYNKLGLYNLPKKSIKYNDILVLNNIWTDYMKDYLNIHGQSPKLPSIDEPGYETFASLVGKADFHGAKITVKQSKCPSLVDLSGIIVLDTKQTFQIVGYDNKLRTIPKNDCIFVIHLNNINFLLYGKHLNIRSAERSVKKIKTMQLPDL